MIILDWCAFTWITSTISYLIGYHFGEKFIRDVYRQFLHEIIDGTSVNARKEILAVCRKINFKYSSYVWDAK